MDAAVEMMWMLDPAGIADQREGFSNEYDELARGTVHRLRRGDTDSEIAAWLVGLLASEWDLDMDLSRVAEAVGSLRRELPQPS